MTFIINKFTLIFQMKNLRNIDQSENAILFSLVFSFCNCPLKRCDDKQDGKMLQQVLNTPASEG